MILYYIIYIICFHLDLKVFFKLVYLKLVFQVMKIIIFILWF